MTHKQALEMAALLGQAHREQMRKTVLEECPNATEEEIARLTRFEIYLAGGGLPTERIIGDASNKKRRRK